MGSENKAAEAEGLVCEFSNFTIPNLNLAIDKQLPSNCQVENT